MTLPRIHTLINLRTSLFIAICFYLGGTSQAINTPKITLYALSIFLIAWVLYKNTLKNIFNISPYLFITLAIFIIYSLCQLIPLPSFIWENLPGREGLSDSFKLMKLDTPSLPLAIVSENVMISILSVLPAIAIFLCLSTLASDKEINLAIWSIPILGLTSLLLGTIQIIDPGHTFYFYETTNLHDGVGVFSNANHQATLMAISLVFSLFLALKLQMERRHRSAPPIAQIVAIIFTMIFTLGLILNGSSAVYILLPVIILCTAFTYLFHSRSRIMKLGVFAAFIAILIIGADFILFDESQRNLLNSLSGERATSRPQIFATTWEAIVDFFPMGTGLGSFRDIYSNYETFADVNLVYVNHAHNDYLEIILELGLIGVVLIAALLFWWASSFFKIIHHNKPMVRAGAVALLVIIIHSMFDYPLRTLTISTIAGMCLALMNPRKLSDN